jgi:molybdate transport system ATP-binding protein
MSTRIEIEISLPLDPFTLEVAWTSDERALGVFGPSGSGKTSLLESIAGLRPQARGCIRVGGRTWFDRASGFRLPPEQRGVGYVPQDALLFPHRNVLQNILTGRRRAERGRGARLDLGRVLEVLELEGRETSDVAALSGGERQRVALARALCAGPELLLLDEPLGGLDVPLRRRILPYLLRVGRTFGVPTIVVTHDAAEVCLLSSDTLILEEGKVVARGRPEELFTGPDLLARIGTIGHTNIIVGRVATVDASIVAIAMSNGTVLTAPAVEGLEKGQEAAVLVRAEDLIVAVESPHGLSAQNVLPGTVANVVAGRAGDAASGGSVAVAIEVRGAAAPIVATVTPQATKRLGIVPGRSVSLIWKTHACRAIAAGVDTHRTHAKREA